MPKEGSIILAVLLIVAIAFATISSVATNRDKNEIKRLNQDLARYQATYLSKQGVTTLVPGDNTPYYDLLSPNGGRDWYALGENREILGPAEEIYPGLLAHLEGFDALGRYAREHGPIGASGTITQEEINILKAAGFEVQPATP